MVNTTLRFLIESSANKTLHHNPGSTERKAWSNPPTWQHVITSQFGFNYYGIFSLSLSPSECELFTWNILCWLLFAAFPAAPDLNEVDESLKKQQIFWIFWLNFHSAVMFDKFSWGRETQQQQLLPICAEEIVSGFFSLVSFNSSTSNECHRHGNERVDLRPLWWTPAWNW